MVAKPFMEKRPMLRREAFRSPCGCHAQNFGRRCRARAALDDSVLENGGHPRRNGGPRYLPGVGARADQVADVLGGLQNLEDAGAAAIARAAAAVATTGLMHDLVLLNAKRRVARIGRERRIGEFLFNLAA